jgi:hypothetical protein
MIIVVLLQQTTIEPKPQKQKQWKQQSPSSLTTRSSLSSPQQC